MFSIKTIIFALSIFVIPCFTQSLYFVTTPHVIRSGETCSITITVTKLTSDASVTVNLFTQNGKYNKESFSTLLTNGNGKTVTKNLKFTVPTDLNGRSIKLEVTGSGGITFKETLNVELETLTGKVFIQTDKPIYKPGGKIKFRIVAIDHHLKPFKVATSIFIQNPSDSRVMQWTNVTLNGMISLEFPLSKKPVLGTWKISTIIKGETTTETVEVDKYVLPKFEVTATTPSYILTKSKKVAVTICAKYTYGKKVQGNLETKICLTNSYRWLRSKLSDSCIKVTKKIDGCTTIDFDGLSIIKEKYRYYNNFKLQVNATVTEEATGIALNTTHKSVAFSKHDIKLQIVQDEHFKPGFPFVTKIVATLPDGRPAINKVVKVKFFEENELYHEKAINITTGEYQFETVSKHTAKFYRVEARYTPPKPQISSKDFFKKQRYYNIYSRDDVTASKTTNAWFSKSNTFVKIGKVSNFEVERVAEVTMRFRFGSGESKATLHYIIVCNGQTVFTDQERLTTTYHRFAFMVTKKMSPTCRFMVYFLTTTGEFVSDYTQLHTTKNVFDNKASITFNKDTSKPGDKVKLTLKASPDSHFALSAVDRSVQLLGDTKDIREEQILNVVKSLDVGKGSLKRDKCPSPSFRWGGYAPTPKGADGVKSISETGLEYFSNADIDILPCPPMIYPEFARPMFRNRGMVLEEARPGNAGPVRPVKRIMMNLKKTRQEKKKLPEIKKMVVKSKASKEIKKVIKTRTEFPETWIWSDGFLNDQTGEKEIEVKVPDTITTWYANGFALSPTDGIGVATPQSIRAFQPFFISLSLPYSVIRDETVKIPATVFNYLDKSLVISLEIKPSSHYDAIGKTSTKLCVGGGQSNTFKFKIKPKTLNHVDVTVQAFSVANDDLTCDLTHVVDTVTVAADALTKKLLVEAEGIKKEFTTSSFFCLDNYPGNRYIDQIEIEVPKPFIKGSVFAQLSVVGDLMGPSIDGLDKLLAMPYGCGEQNMLKFAPNIYIMDYLTATNQVTQKISEQAKEFMRSGYQRELTYKHSNGAYSAFGERDKEGSTWLTAFVLRTYAQAQRYIFIDPKDIKDSMDWLLSLQDPTTGCFRELGMIHHKEMKGGVTSGITMTSFVLTSLLEADLSHTHLMYLKIQNALKCIKQGLNDVNDPYTAAVLAYSLSLAGDSKKIDMLNKLKTMEIKADGLIHWEGKSESTKPVQTSHWYTQKKNPANIEMTAYALMAYSGGRTPFGSRLDHFKMLKWLVKQRNSYGGFASTQDTCVGLQALAHYAAGSFSGAFDLNLIATSTDNTFSQTFKVDSNNKLLLQRSYLDKVPLTLNLEATGKGCALVQASVKYNIPDEKDLPSFMLTHTINHDKTSMSCKHSMKICGSFKGTGKSNMALIDVTMVSGFEPITSELDMIMQSSTSTFSYYEFEEGKLSFYFDEFDQYSKCVEFSMEQMAEVEDRKPATIVLYDYYDTENSATKMYSVGACPEMNVVS